MKILKTNDIFVVLYGILRQLEENDVMTCNLINDETIKISYYEANSIDQKRSVMKKISYLRKALLEGRHLIIFTSVDISFKIWTNEYNEFLVDNLNIIINYILYELLYYESVPDETMVAFVSPINEKILDKVTDYYNRVYSKINQDFKKTIHLKTRSYEFSFTVTEYDGLKIE